MGFIGRRISVAVVVSTSVFCIGALTGALRTAPQVTSARGAFRPTACEPSSILAHNAKLGLYLGLGWITFGTSTAIGLYSAGVSISDAIALSRAYGTPFRTILAATLPHAVLEVPAIVIFGAGGLFGAWALRAARGSLRKARTLFVRWLSLIVLPVALLGAGAAAQCTVSSWLPQEVWGL